MQGDPTCPRLEVPCSASKRRPRILADCQFNGDAKCGPEEMPGGTRRAYRALATQLRETLASV